MFVFAWWTVDFEGLGEIGREKYRAGRGWDFGYCI